MKKPLTLRVQNNGVGFLPYAGIIRVRFDGCILSCRIFGQHPEMPVI
jgi:hypothetical protein